MILPFLIPGNHEQNKFCSRVDDQPRSQEATWGSLQQVTSTDQFDPWKFHSLLLNTLNTLTTHNPWTKSQQLNDIMLNHPVSVNNNTPRRKLVKTNRALWLISVTAVVFFIFFSSVQDVSEELSIYSQRALLTHNDEEKPIMYTFYTSTVAS